ncbi:MAG: type II secretion system protein [Proteobacteria bacterium]|nr:type II secretion system protein [Pseudomonadota bacterium]
MKNILPARHRKTKSQHGFSIMELTVVLTIIALIAGSALAVGASRVEQQKIQTTQERIEFIISAIETFVVKFGYLPCPADASLNNNDPDFGVERVPGVGGSGEGTQANQGNCHRANYKDPATNVVAGLVPVRTLLISPGLAMDGWGRRISYVVDENLTWRGGPGIGGYADDTQGEIEIHGAGGTVVTTEGAFLVMSYGTNGHGAWKAKGVDRLDKGITDADEKENSWDGNGVAGNGAFNSIFVQKFLSRTFDDLVQYRVKWQLPEYKG